MPDYPMPGHISTTGGPTDCIEYIIPVTHTTPTFYLPNVDRTASVIYSQCSNDSVLLAKILGHVASIGGYFIRVTDYGHADLVGHFDNPEHLFSMWEQYRDTGDSFTRRYDAKVFDEVLMPRFGDGKLGFSIPRPLDQMTARNQQGIRV